MMKINIDYDENIIQPKKNLHKIRSALCFLSLRRLLVLFCSTLLILFILILCRIYIKSVLTWLEKQDTSIVIAAICFLFTLVSLPISIGYIVLVVASGYMFGIIKGILVVIFGANFGILIAHNILKLVGQYSSIYR